MVQSTSTPVYKMIIILNWNHRYVEYKYITPCTLSLVEFDVGILYNRANNTLTISTLDPHSLFIMHVWDAVCIYVCEYV